MNEFQRNIRDGKASEILDQIKSSHDKRRVLDWPGRPDVKIEMRLLTLSECRQAKVENQQEFKKDGIDIAVHNLVDYREQEAVHGMWRVFTDPTTGNRIFNSAEEMRSFCTPDELTALCAAYNAFAEENDPNVGNLSDEDVKTLIELLKKTPDQVQRKVTSLNTAWKLLRTLVAQQAN